MTTLADLIQYCLQYILHIDTYLFAFASTYGFWTYVILFAIIFCETGLIITPFLPGDSLLFVAGSIAAHNQILEFEWLFLLLVLASILGNQINYLIGRWVGVRIFTLNNRLLHPKHLIRAHQFYEKHGGKTIILARFIPIIRTMVPFVAGVSTMNAPLYFFYNVVSAIVWIGGLLTAGYFFGSLPLIKENFSLVIYSIILISILPTLFLFIYRKLASATSA